MGALSIALAVALASPPLATASLPAYAPAYEPRSVDERGMWMEADEYERLLRDSAARIKDPTLDAYLKSVLCKTVGQERCGPVRIYVVEFPAFNASMMANGTLTIWSGLLLRTRSEAELASVLGHEFAHFELRHSLAGFRQKRSASDMIAWASVLGAAAAVNTSFLQLSLVGSAYRFDREQEKAADLLGFRYLAQSPYAASAAPIVWQNLMAENDATNAGRKRKPKHRYWAGFFDTHPTDLNRATYLGIEAAKVAKSGQTFDAEYRTAFATYLPRFLDAQIKLNDFGGTEFLLNEIASATSWTGPLLFARGEMYRARGNPRDLVAAADYYRQAISLGYRAPEVRRNLGLALLRSGSLVEAKAQLRTYLELVPDAPDAKMIAALTAE